MNALIGAVGLITVAAITPGPNNLVVMRTAVHSGFAGALPAIAGIVAGGLAMLLLVVAGAGVLFAAEPRLYHLITYGGGAYLCWLGIVLLRDGLASPGRRTASPARALPVSGFGMFGFQFLNPKSWIMVLTVTSAVRVGNETAHVFLVLAALFTVIPALCLTLWCALGVLLRTYPAHQWLDGLMGALLIISALLLVASLDDSGNSRDLPHVQPPHRSARQ
jgi:threonine/homoserine/homoserine lactone efflux protein